jgi:hypothetical protein
MTVYTKQEEFIVPNSSIRKRYTSDMTDNQWQLIRPLLPLKNDGPGRPLELDMRRVVDAIFYMWYAPVANGRICRAIIQRVCFISVERYATNGSC